MSMKTLAAIIIVALVSGFVLGGIGIAGAGDSAAVPAMQCGTGACGDGSGACGTGAGNGSFACPKGLSGGACQTAGQGACGNGSCP